MSAIYRFQSAKFQKMKSLLVSKKHSHTLAKVKHQGKFTIWYFAIRKLGEENKMFSFSPRLIIKPEYAFGEKGNDAFKIPPNATVEYTVTLQEFEREPESWKLNAEESLSQAKLIKDKATTFLKEERYELAIKLFEKANTYLSNCTCKYLDAFKC